MKPNTTLKLYMQRLFAGLRHGPALPLSLIAIMLVQSNTAFSSEATTVQTRTKQDDEVGSYGWTLQTENGVRFQLIQRVPDQTRSFYVARGFPLEAADRYATACVFQTIVENGTDNKELTIDLHDWEVRNNGNRRPLRLTGQWQRRWEETGVSDSARIAFQWSQFPTVQRHAPGDWFQGMIATEVPPDTEFGLVIRWKENGQPREAVLKQLECAQDRTLIN